MPKHSSDDEEEVERPLVAKSAADLQRLKLQKLMKNPDKPVIIPERPKTKGTPSVPEFVRNVMGSSAGAGSGEFHVYRHLRRKEYARQKFIQEKGQKELLDEEYHKKLEENKKLAEELTAKKRAKRLKKKQKLKQKKFKPSHDQKKNGSESKLDGSSAEDESSDNEKPDDADVREQRDRSLECVEDVQVSEMKVEGTVAQADLKNEEVTNIHNETKTSVESQEAENVKEGS
ncbi:hypothetical protein QAD02_022935 [Eretmocerus hayati]|uniref:Uncharacterized protein n=1 Tax=Eretmocerus hayati TaxID=131215 RepID=A0ACC2PUD8_9HYME|nr:hypothetical protein QAD02_022935 [Eretmocerus hayati]